MGHVVDGIQFVYPPCDAGLFAAIGTTGVVRNLGVVNESAMTLFGRAGLVAVINAGLITNTYSSGEVATLAFRRRGQAGSSE
ncbi:hypothetical protein [Paraburkholderia sp. MM6662-R1]|uniref:hypothetical protein n=1 Tax=Paraburkholderia sp. MM6662-R1 TaxID=2991066 RepID=UPI003D1EF530